MKNIKVRRRYGFEENSTYTNDLVPSCGIVECAGHVILGFAAVAAVSFGPAWVVVPVVIAYAAMVG